MDEISNEDKKAGSDIPPILQEVKKHGFKVFTGPFDMNIVGVRNPHGEINKFDDKIFVVYQDQDLNWICKSYAATTDAGLYFMNKPMRAAGTAVLIDPYQYRGIFTIGKHRGVYDCLVQTKPMPVWRDSNKNDIIDEFTIGSATAIQIHRASSKWRSQRVEKWSAGCQVIADPKDFQDFMYHVTLQLKHHPTWRSFTYTLIKCEV
jgi:hypothetical protein